MSESKEVEKKATEGMLSSALSAIESGALYAYAVGSEFAKSKLSDENRKKIEDAEASAKEKLGPLIEKIKEKAGPAVDFADKKLEVAADKLLATETGKRLKDEVIPGAAKKSKELFDLTCLELNKIGEKGKGTMIAVDDYVKAVKEKMGKEWDEKFMAPVKSLYEQAKEKGMQTGDKLKEQTANLLKTWSEKVEPVLLEREYTQAASAIAKELGFMKIEPAKE
eukprot:CAMPEP_0170169788 /NCGR_PEP_ID=MMETSP0040_2-20121228/2724_1 /TAXON_ID=641309 /ORGANISM="Lotharella oceanica, Strain CCMP622" /LENGTH=222 /DNA_ID=CAMNT_0010408749 /DNA_START=30 /DNA_END=698 /DNA_ORIENTATION=-